MEKHYLDAFIFDSETWVRGLLDLLDALEVQLAIEDELAEETDALGGYEPDGEL